MPLAVFSTALGWEQLAIMERPTAAKKNFFILKI
jgi:hypothetical protein